MDLLELKMQAYHQPSEHSYKFLEFRYPQLVTREDLLGKLFQDAEEQLDALRYGHLHQLEFSTTSKRQEEVLYRLEQYPLGLLSNVIHQESSELLHQICRFYFR